MCSPRLYLFFAFFLLFLSYSAQAKENYIYKGEIYDSKEEAETALSAYIQANGIGDRFEEIATSSTALFQYDLYFNPVSVEPTEHYSPCYGVCSQEQESLADWEDQTRIDSQSNTFLTCPESAFSKHPETDWEFSSWVNATGAPWGNAKGKKYVRDYKGLWTYYQLAGDPLQSEGWSCNAKTTAIEATIVHYVDMSNCPSGSYLSGFPEGEVGQPTCKSNSASEYIKYMSCTAPYEYSVADNACVTYCPPEASFDTELGMCVNDKDDSDQCDAQALNPIDMLRGEKKQNFVDFTQQLPLPLAYIRSYRSQRAPASANQLAFGINSSAWKKYFQPAGFGGSAALSGIAFNQDAQGNVQWRHNFQYHLFSYNNGKKIYIRLPDGTVRKFTQALNSYVSAVGKGDLLNKQSDGSWLYTSSDNLQHRFEASGLLTRINDEVNNKLYFSYGTNNELLSVKNGHGQQLLFEYDQSGRIAKVSLPTGNELLHSFDARGNLVSVMHVSSSAAEVYEQEVYHYEDANNAYALTGITDAKGIRYASWAYNAHGQAISSTHVGGADAGTIAYDPTNNSAVVIDVSNKSKSLSFNNAGRIDSVSGQSCSTSGTESSVSFVYDSQGRVTQKTWANGAVETFSYDTNGFVTTNTLASGTADEQKTSWTYGASYAKPVKITHPNGRVENITLGNFGRTMTYKDSVGGVDRTTNYIYMNNGKLAAVDGPQPGSTDKLYFGYPVNSFIGWIKNALGQVTSFSGYNGFGQPTLVTDANGVKTTLSYDYDGRITQIHVEGKTGSTEESNTYTFTYDLLGQLIQQSFPSGESYSYEYDDARRLAKIMDGAGNAVNYNYDAAGNATKVELKDSQDQATYVVNRVFDQIKRLIQITDNQQNSWNFEYDQSDNLLKTITPLQTSIEYLYDKLDRITEVTEKDGSKTTSSHDKNDQINLVSDANSLSTSYEYNGFGEITKLTSPDSGIASFSYDLAGNLTSSTDARAVTANYQYDLLNRLTAINYPDSTEDVTLGYDEATAGRNGLGRLTSAQANGIGYQYDYNLAGQVTRVASSIDYNNVQTQAVLEYQYTDGLLSQITYPSGAKIGYSYSHDKISAVTLTTLDGEGQPEVQTLASNINYLPFGPLNSLSYGNGKILSQQYDLDYQLISKSISGVVQKSYSFNAMDNITGIDDNLAPGKNQGLGYDAMSRLLTATGEYGELAYSYDAIGNRLSKTEAGQTDTYVYDNNHLLEAGGLSRSYDAVGNLIQRGSDSFTYNDANRLEQATVATGTYIYRYDHQGQRVIKDSNGQVKLYHYGPDGLLLAELDQASNTLVEYIYLNGQRLAMRIGAELYYVHSNHLDAPLALTDTSGDIVWQASYSPFGKISVDINLLSESITARFPGQYADAESGFYYNYFRDYDPEIGRYIQSDPIGLGGGINTYGYVGGNPIMFVDPLGLCACGLPSSSNFMNNYPDYNNYSGSDVWNLIGGSLNDNYGENSPGGTENSCAARVSHGLNESGANIPNSPQHQTNKNWGGNNNRYIISASHMHSYLRSTYGAPSQTLTNASQLSILRTGLASGQAAIVSSSGHAAVVTSTYADPYVSSYLGDVWILPTGACSCN